ncbi:hypothetical protein [Pontibacter sp. G13]|uniref:helix-turn-helix and ligand-binding sensor domain-containing protein n=1 Tax=Pontibacter sp. G13 TaxID=3074898 RepID=UPI00288A0CE0|nr:hypothetical protein [Pontibacter sp. G13]WNJ19297.1 hypothetical protein RJD25_02295 [Pontibacter sp. G13]
MSYDKLDYQAGRQNWAAEIDDQGVVYFGNSDGLVYNVFGEWGFATMSQQGVIRALKAQQDTIWAGGKEFGYFTKSGGELSYSQLEMLYGEQVWNIEGFVDRVVFQTENYLIIYDKISQTHCKVWSDHGYWDIVQWNDQPWTVLRNGEIGYLDEDTFRPVARFDELTGLEVRELFVRDDQLYLILIDGRIYRFDGKSLTAVPLPQEMAGKTLFAGIPYDDSSIALGSISDGFLLVDDAGEILEWAHADNGLLDNTVLSMVRDELGNVWLGLDYGIAKVELQSPINSIFEGAATYSIQPFRGNTYIGTNKGLFEAPASGEFEFVPQSGGQVWEVKEIDGVLYVCHTRGLMKLEGGLMRELTDVFGFVDIERFGGTDYFLFTTYNGLFLARKDENGFRFLQSLNIWSQPRLTYDAKNQCIWGQIMHFHVLKFSLQPDATVDVQEYREMGKVFDTDFGLIFTDRSRFYEFRKGEFQELDHPLINLLKGNQIQTMDMSRDGNSLAYIQDHEVKLNVLLPDGNPYSYHTLLKSLGQNTIPDYEFLDLDGNLLMVATDRGVKTFDIDHRSPFKKHSKPVISSITVLNEDHRRLFFPFPSEGLSFSSGNKDLALKFGIHKSKHDIVEYRYRLEPEDEAWSPWSAETDQIMFPQLTGGTYTFHLESRINGGTPHATSLEIKIDKLWYQTAWVILPIALLSLIWIFGVVAVMARINLRKLKKQAEQFQQREAQERLSMKNEQMLQYLEIISHKNAFLNQIKSGLEGMRNNEAKRWVNMITDEVNNEKKEFLFHKLFSEIHQDFVSRLGHEFPSLTSNDLRVLSFIRINLDKVEICNLMNISPRSLDTHRYRLRKKLALEKGSDLDQFIRDF